MYSFFIFLLIFLKYLNRIRPKQIHPINKNKDGKGPGMTNQKILILRQTLKNPKSFKQIIFHYLTNNNIRNVTRLYLRSTTKKNK